MSRDEPAPSARRLELLELAYRHVLERGLSELSLRPLAADIGSSPRVLLYLFGSKDGLVRALLTRARADELELLERLRAHNEPRPLGLARAVEEIWSWLCAPQHRALLTLWLEGYSRSLTDSAADDDSAPGDTVAETAGSGTAAHEAAPAATAAGHAGSAATAALDTAPWGGFARSTVEDWLAVLAAAQPAALRVTEQGAHQRTLALAVLRGALLDLLATGDAERTTGALRAHLAVLTG